MEKIKTMESIRLEGIGKRYRLGKKVAVMPFLSGFARKSKKTEPEIWALKDMSFSVSQGEALGIIGANGAGKTTLLKILARVTAPTEGKAVTPDRVFSLLSLGTGLQPDETARENIAIHGAFYGLSAQETSRLIQETIQFAELEKFEDTLVRHFSSGMYLRLIFSIAVNLKPQVILADEVLAVGDIGFQRKCLEKLAEVSRMGVTVLVVSHDMDLIRRLCTKCLWIDQGRQKALGEPAAVTAEFERFSTGRSADDKKGKGALPKNDALSLISTCLLSDSQEMIGVARYDEDFFIRFNFEVHKTPLQFGAVIDVYADNILVFRSGTSSLSDVSQKGHLTAQVKIPGFLLADRQYHVNLHCRAQDAHGVYPLVQLGALKFLVHEDGAQQEHQEAITKHNRHAVVAPRLQWEVGGR